MAADDRHQPGRRVLHLPRPRPAAARRGRDREHGLHGGPWGSYQHAHYSAAKGAVLSFSRSLALELAPRVRVNAVSPGLIDTPLIKPLLAARGDELLKATPLKRLGTPEEVARVIAFLCSDWASFVTGETVHINGGLYIVS